MFHARVAPPTPGPLQLTLHLLLSVSTLAEQNKITN
jgi:hypothetical protein